MSSKYRNNSLAYKHMKKTEFDLLKEQDYKLCATNMKTLMASFEEVVNIYYQPNNLKKYDFYISNDFSKKSFQDLLSQIYTQLRVFSGAFNLLKQTWGYVKDFETKIFCLDLENYSNICKRSKRKDIPSDKFEELIFFAKKILIGEDSNLNENKSKYIIDKKQMGEKELKMQIGSILSGVNDFPLSDQNLGKTRNENPLYKQNIQNNEIFNFQKKNDLITRLKNFTKRNDSKNYYSYTYKKNCEKIDLGLKIFKFY